ncbi:MAG: hypothetical protein KBC81_03885 [Candidatus Pacebacteria bacterium]|nr:hypothetical protein [Candidatus Paceibacterota bacterium]
MEILARLEKTFTLTGTVNSIFEDSVRAKRELATAEIQLILLTLRELQTELKLILDPEIQEKLCGNCGSRRLVRITSHDKLKGG